MPLFAIPFPAIDPVLIQFGPLAIHWYALAYIAGLVLGWRYVAAMFRRPALWRDGTAPMGPEGAEELLSWMAAGVILGGRLGYVLFYRPEYYFANPVEIVQVWKGGMSFHGGLIGSITAIALFCRAHKAPALSVGDAVACAAPLGLLFGRIANFINGELWGRASDAPWAVIFPNPAAGGIPRHPSQIYEAGLEGAVLFAILYLMAWRMGALKRPGACIGVFFIGYGLARIFVENFRQMDDFLGYVIPIGAGGITMGMILSAPMVLIGIGFAIWSRRAP